MFSCKFCETFNNTFLRKHLRPTPPPPKFRPTPLTPFFDPRYPRQNFMDPRYPRYPHQNLVHATYAPTLPTPPTRFSRLVLVTSGKQFLFHSRMFHKIITSIHHYLVFYYFAYFLKWSKVHLQWVCFHASWKLFIIYHWKRDIVQKRNYFIISVAYSFLK